MSVQLVERRRALHVIGASTLLACASNPPSTEDAALPDTRAEALEPQPDAPSCVGAYQGAVEDFPENSWHIVGTGANRLFISRADNGLYAYAATCTHATCALVLVDDFGNARCPCHGAEFDGNGDVTKGPATDSLPHYALSVCDRRVFVDTSVLVHPQSRTVP